MIKSGRQFVSANFIFDRFKSAYETFNSLMK